MQQYNYEFQPEKEVVVVSRAKCSEDEDFIWDPEEWKENGIKTVNSDNRLSTLNKIVYVVCAVQSLILLVILICWIKKKKKKNGTHDQLELSSVSVTDLE